MIAIKHAQVRIKKSRRVEMPRWVINAATVGNRNFTTMDGSVGLKFAH